MNLSLRLQKIADFVPEGGSVADIGTDHAHLPIYLVQSLKNKNAIAMDVRPGPLSRAEQAITMCRLSDKIETRLSDGLTALKPGEADTVVIAGMGGALIQKILEEGRHVWDSVTDWILSPQSEIYETRHWLEDHGFAIRKEDMVLDSGKYYVVMHVTRGAMHYTEEYEYIYGRELIQHKNPVLKAFLEQEQRKLLLVKQRIQENLEECGRTVSEKNRKRNEIRLQEICAEAAELLRALEDITGGKNGH
ncbi:MAG: class I SAM-dependent methyltransferase [Lachnospiraceae bacterium]|nr:class I SAM-dependent methyltransferase [Lachnospiraceae bacterium]